MTSNKIIRAILEEQHLTQTALGARVGMTCNRIADRLLSVNMNIKSFVQLLHAMDYKLVAVPRDARMPKGAYEVEIGKASEEE